MTPKGQSRKPAVAGYSVRRNRRSITYLVSGEESIRPSHQNLRRTGRTVRFDTEVDEHAAVALKTGRRFVVVAHGRADGTVMWFSSARGVSVPWLWVGMERQPSGSRIYLYSCKAGEQLPQHLDRCECFGHVDDVPMPTASTRTVVLRYLNQVDRLVGDPESDVNTWRQRLGEYVNRRLMAEADNPTHFMNSVALQLLRRSLGYVDE
jgi:hypothetical protein